MERPRRPAVPSRRSCRPRRWRTTRASCAARSPTRCSSTCRRCRRERWAAAAEAFVAGRAAQAAGRRAQEHRRRDAGRAARAGVRGAVRPRGRAEVAIVAEIPHPSGRGPALRLAGKIDRLVRDRRFDPDRRLQDQPAAAEGRGQGCGSLPAATRRLPAGRQPHFLTTACQGRHSLDGRPAESWRFRARCCDAAEQRLWQLDPAEP